MTAPPVPHQADLVVALDVAALEEARRLVRLLHPQVTWFKVGLELYTAAGPAAVALVTEAGGRVVLDLKLHDIPNTVACAVRSAATLGADLLTLHLAGGEAMVRAAVEAVHPSPRRLRLLGVTRLTSEPVPAAAERWRREVADAARLGAALGLDGAVVAAAEAAAVRAACPVGFLTLVPGIRPAGAAAGDQARVATPVEAAQAGADFVVVGRPITRAPDPPAAAAAILAEMAAAGAGV